MSNRIQFNTGRQYTAKGQRIVAIRQGEDVIFMDHDRKIAGLIEDFFGDLTPQNVVGYYDAGSYVMHTPTEALALA